MEFKLLYSQVLFLPCSSESCTLLLSTLLILNKSVCLPNRRSSSSEIGSEENWWCTNNKAIWAWRNTRNYCGADNNWLNDDLSPHLHLSVEQTAIVPSTPAADVTLWRTWWRCVSATRGSQGRQFEDNVSTSLHIPNITSITSLPPCIVYRWSLTANCAPATSVRRWCTVLLWLSYWNTFTCLWCPIVLNAINYCGH